ncbi:MAG: peptide synthetase, partial [Rhodobacter sp.]|nr:peptide synthetase [Rhodobacter sp.]
AADEIVVALGASIGGRPHHRIGDRYQDLKDLGHDASNPAAV